MLAVTTEICPGAEIPVTDAGGETDGGVVACDAPPPPQPAVKASSAMAPTQTAVRGSALRAGVWLIGPSSAPGVGGAAPKFAARIASS